MRPSNKNRQAFGNQQSSLQVHHPLQRNPQSRQAEAEPDQVRQNHQTNINPSRKRTKPAVHKTFPKLSHLRTGKIGFHKHLRHNEDAHAPAPSEQVQSQVVPKRDEAKNDPNIENLVPRASERDEQVPDEPLIEGSVPHPPEPFKAVVVRHAPAHIFGAFNAVEQRPDPEVPPNDCKLEPDPLEDKVTGDDELVRPEPVKYVTVPDIIRDRGEVQAVDEPHEHCEDQQEPQKVSHQAAETEGLLWLRHLRDPSVVGQGRPCEVKWRVEDVACEAQAAEVLAVALHAVLEALDRFAALVTLAQMLLVGGDRLVGDFPVVVDHEADHLEHAQVADPVPLQLVRVGVKEAQGRGDPGELVPVVVLGDEQEAQVACPGQ